MLYSESQVGDIVVAPTREFGIGLTVATPEPPALAPYLLQDFMILAFPQDPFACALRALAPLAGRQYSSPLVGSHRQLPIHP